MALGETEFARRIFGRRDTVFAVKDEAEMQACDCAQAVPSPIARTLDDAANWLGGGDADPAQGETL